MGRVLRSKYDYGMMIFADKRYKMKTYTDKLPVWIRDQLFNTKTRKMRDFKVIDRIIDRLEEKSDDQDLSSIIDDAMT